MSRIARLVSPMTMITTVRAQRAPAKLESADRALRRQTETAKTPAFGKPAVFPFRRQFLLPR